MSNRKKPKRSGLLRRQAVRDAIESDRKVRGQSPKQMILDEVQKTLEEVTPPNNEKELLKTVPLKADGVVIGIAHLYDDGTVDCIVDEAADPEAIAKVRALEGQMQQFDLRITDR